MTHYMMSLATGVHGVATMAGDGVALTAVYRGGVAGRAVVAVYRGGLVGRGL